MDPAVEHKEMEYQDTSTLSPLQSLPSRASSVELAESKTTELDEDQFLCKNSVDLDRHDIATSNASSYYTDPLPSNFNPKSNPKSNASSYDTASTVALAYSLELQSRLQHLDSLLDSAHSVDAEKYLIDDAQSIDSGDDGHRSAESMMASVHSNNMRLVEAVIERVVDGAARADPANAERDRHFYATLYDTVSPPKGRKGGNGGNVHNEWSQSLPRKRRPSVEEVAYRHVDRSARALWADAVQWAQTLSSNVNLSSKVVSNVSSSPRQFDVFGAATSAVMLYCCGALYFVVEQRATVSVVSFVVGALLIALVLGIGVLFERAATLRDWNALVAASVLSVATCYIAVVWVAVLVNVSAAAVLVAAVLMAFQYSHGPVAAKGRHLDEIWICILFNCGLVLFSYFMQCPEMTVLSIDTAGAAAVAVAVEQQSEVIEAVENVVAATEEGMATSEGAVDGMWFVVVVMVGMYMES